MYRTMKSMNLSAYKNIVFFRKPWNLMPTVINDFTVLLVLYQFLTDFQCLERSSFNFLVEVRQQGSYVRRYRQCKLVY